MPIKNESRRDVAQVCSLLFLVFAVFGNSLLNGFIYDDSPQILSNPYVHNFRHLREIFTTSVWSFQGAEATLSYYRPLMTLGYAVCWWLFGPVPLGYHFFNVALHAAVVLLVFVVSQRLFQDAVLAWAAAMLFAIHPVHTESVAWVVGVGDLELTFFYLLTFWLFLDMDRPGRPQPWIRHVLLATSYALALLSKEQAATLPVLAIVYEHFYREDRNQTTVRQKLSRYGTLWALLGVYLLVRVHWLGVLIAGRQRAGLSNYEVVLSAIALVGQYTGKLLWPAHLVLFYDFHKSVRFFESGVILGLASLLAWLALFFLAGTRRAASFGVIWLLLTLAPVLNARWMVTNAFAERYLYLPSVGFCWLAAFGLRKAWSLLEFRPAAWRALMAGALCGLGLLCAVRIVGQNTVWRDQETLNRYALNSASSSTAGYMHANLGAIYWNHGDFAAAEREWVAAFEQHPENSALLVNLGLLRAKQGRDAEAVAYLQTAIRQQPNFTEAYMTLGNLQESGGRVAEAEVQYRAALKIAPLNIGARNLLGTLLYKEKRLAEAEQELRRSVEIDSNPSAYDRLGDIYSDWGDGKRAEQAFAQAASMERFDSHAHFGLAKLYAARGLSNEAAREYEAGLQTDSRNVEALLALQRLKTENQEGKVAGSE